MDARTVPLGELTLKIGSGATPRGGKESYKSEGIALFRSLNVYDLQFDASGLAYIDDEQAGRLSNVEVLPGDVLLNITGASVARCALAPSHLLPARVNQHVAILRPDPELLDARFLNYTLVSPHHKGRLLAIAQGGATREALTKRTLEQFDIPVPPLQDQRKIAAVLAPYDELIENNLRRIEILEEMAQAVYREWFVNFRFPGHEDVALVDSPLGPIPEAWEAMPFSELADFVNGFAFKPAHLGDTGLPVVKIKELKNGVTPDTPRNPGTEIAEKFHIDPGDLLFSWSADLVVQLWPHGPALLNQHLFRVLPKKPHIDLDFLVHALTQRLPEFRARAQGTTMRHIKRSALTEVQTVVPPAGLRALFAEAVKPVHQLARNLVLQNANLRTTRDLLLPKLVSGEIDVSDLDIDTGWLAS